MQLVQVVAAEELDPIPYGAYLPASHKEPVQTDDPESSLYLPASQSPQVEATLAPTASENLPGGQAMQLVEPVVRPQRPTTSQVHMYMYICIEDVCVCVYPCSSGTFQEDSRCTYNLPLRSFLFHVDCNFPLAAR